MDYKELGKRISALRRELGLTQKELADMLGVTDKAVSKWETGRSLPDPALLLPLAARLHTTVDTILGGSPGVENAGADVEPAPETRRIQSVAEYASGQMVRMRKQARVVAAILLVAVVVLGVIAATRSPSPNSLDTIINRGGIGVLASAELTRQEEALLDFAAVGGGAGETFTCRLPEGQTIKEFGTYRFVEGEWQKCPMWEGSSEKALFSMSYRGSTIQINLYNGAGGMMGISHTYFEEGESSISAFAGSDSTEDPSINLSPGTFMVPVVWGGTAEDQMIGPMVPLATEAEWLAHRENPGPTEVRVCLYITIE